MRQSRIGDLGQGICPGHNTPVSYITVFCTGTKDVTTNNKRSAVIGSIGVSSCGHPTIAVSGAMTVTKDNLRSHRVGDRGNNAGPYVAVTGAVDVEVEKN